jgi:hypothetical protein
MSKPFIKIWVNEPAVLTKKELGDKAQVIINKVRGGEVNALDAFLAAKAMEKVSKTIQEAIKDESVTEAMKYSKDERLKFGAKFQVTEGRTMFDYEADDEYKRLKDALAFRKGLLDQAIQGKEKGLTISVPDTGEVVLPPPVKGGTETTISVTFN